MAVLDAHCHFWTLDRGDYGWLAGTGGPLDPIRRDYTPADYPAPNRVIAVQAAPTVAETEFLLGLAARTDRIAGVVGWVDLSDTQAVATLHRLAANPGLVGIRPMLQDIADTDWLLTHARPDAIAALCDLGLTFDALVTDRHLPMLGEFAAAHPALPIVVDHAAKPQPGPREGWDAGLQRLAGLPNVACKLSGLMTELSEDQRRDPRPALHAIMDRLRDLFGAERLIWGSDWPVLTLAASWADWRDLTDALLSGLDADARAAILGGNAERLYGVAA